MIRKFILFIIGVCLASMLSVGTAKATTLVTANLNLIATDDLSINAKGPLNVSGGVDYTNTVGGTAKTISYLKFDLSGLKSIPVSNISSVKLSMYGMLDEEISDVVKNSISVYYIQDQTRAWSETNTFSWVNKPSYDTSSSIGTVSSGSNDYVQYLWTLYPTPGADIVADISRGYITFAIQDNSPADTSRTLFFSKDNSSIPAADKPQLMVTYTKEVSTPSPEPSAMLLGLLSIGGGLFGLKRRKKD